MGKEETKSIQKTYYAAITKNFDVAVCCSEKDATNSIKSSCGKKPHEKNIARFKIYLVLDREDCPHYFEEVQYSEPEFAITREHMERLYTEVYYFLRGKLYLKPKMKKVI